MTIKLDLRYRPQAAGTILTPFGCADCGQWFQFARELVTHLREHAKGTGDE